MCWPTGWSCSTRDLIAQEGAPDAVYARPADSFVARFLGCPNLLPVQGAASTAGQWMTSIGPLPRDLLAVTPGTTPPRYVLLPTAAELVGATAGAAAGMIVRGHVVRTSFRGDVWRVHMAPDADPALRLTFDLRAVANPLPGAGAAIAVEIDPQRLVAIPE